MFNLRPGTYRGEGQIHQIKDSNNYEVWPQITLQTVTDECQRLINLKRDNSRIEEKNISRVQAIKQPKFTKYKAKSSQCDASVCVRVCVCEGLIFKKRTVFF